MIGLMDIAPSTRSVQVGGQSVKVVGVSAQGIAYLIGRFPQIKDMIASKEGIDLSPEGLLTVIPEAIATIIAAGCGYVNDKVAEEVAATLPAETQLDLLKEIVALTMPSGAGPFVAKLTAAMSLLDVSGKAPATQSPSQSSN